MIRHLKSTLPLLAWGIILSSCNLTHNPLSVPALLEHSSSEIRIVLEQAIGNLINSPPIKLADNVFTNKSTVIVEPRQPKDSRGNLLDGWEIRPADIFSLLTEDGKCYIKHDQSRRVNLLDNISCKAK